MAKKLTNNDNLKNEIQIQKDRVTLYSAQAIAMLMEASVAATQNLLDLMKDTLIAPSAKMEHIQYILDKVLPSLPDGMVKQDFQAIIEGFLAQIEDDV